MQVEKEALALIFGVQHFHAYLYGCSFTIGFWLRITTRLSSGLQESMGMRMDYHVFL